MTDTETARRIMATGIVGWAPGMRATAWYKPGGAATLPYWEACRVFAVDDDGTTHACSEWSGRVRPVGPEQDPDLNDDPTCDAMEGQVVAAIQEALPGHIIEIQHTWVYVSRFTKWRIYPDGYPDDAVGLIGPRPAALLAACEWLKGVRDAAAAQ